MMLRAVSNACCRSAAALRSTSTPTTTATIAARRTMMMMAGGDVPSPMNGVCKSFNVTRGFGFISPEDGNGQDIFVHQSEIKREGFRFLVQGEAVQFQMEETETGRKALNVTGPGGAPLPARRTEGGSGGSMNRGPRRGPPRRSHEGGRDNAGGGY